jgi:N6-L-threonylcarbamoyladenine synthase
MNVLGIETSCDETCASVVKDARFVLSNVVASSLKLHAVYGGIIPEIASRAHLESIVSVVDAAMRQARVCPKDLDLIAVTQGPGLIGSLLVGISFAKALSLGWKVPVVAINHLKAHLYAPFIDHDISYPFVGLVVSGGHTNLYKVTAMKKEELLSATRDDAAGEAFDKVAKIMGLSYPGGPVIEKLAKSGRKDAYVFRCECGDGLDFSFSGIKTAVLYKVRDLVKMYGSLSQSTTKDLCASFQEVVVEDLVCKSLRAAQEAHAKILVVGGGVAFNNYLRSKLETRAADLKIKLLIAGKSYCLDNAAMVASLGGRLFKAKMIKHAHSLDPLMG